MSEEEEILTPEIRFHLIKKMERHKVIALGGATLLPHEVKYLEFHGVAGVILFERNIHSLSQVNELIGRVVEYLSATEPDLPPLVMADHEGDLVAELRRIIGMPPSAMAIAATGDPDLAREVARETGLAMRKLGVNVVLAPVADCFLDAASPITGLRTFGAEPERVAEYVASTITGYHEAGVLTCAKHFPGHGSTPDDSHDTLPEVRKSLDALRREDLVPFRRATEVGVDMMMISHVAFPLGSDVLAPASFDARIVNGLLRQEIGFDGVVITDSLEMAGARWYAQGYRGEVPSGGGFERSLLAGADLLLHARPVPDAVEVGGAAGPVMSLNVMETIIRTLEKVVDRERIEEKLVAAAEKNEALRNVLDILDRSSRRVADLRKRAAQGAPSPVKAPRGSKVIQLDTYPSVPAVYRRVAQQSITRLATRPEQGSFLSDSPCVVVPVEYAPSQSLKKHDVDGFVDALCKHFPHWQRTDVVTRFVVGEDGETYPDIHMGPPVVDAARFTGAEATPFEPSGDENTVVVFSCRGKPPVEFLSDLEAVAKRYEPAVVLVLGWPVTEWVPETTPVLLCFGASPQVASAAAEVLSGKREPVGKARGLWPM
jgi:beta-N-acetylhexosaminidase